MIFDGTINTMCFILYIHSFESPSHGKFGNDCWGVELHSRSCWFMTPPTLRFTVNIIYICSFMGEHRQTINYDKLIFLGPLCSGPLVSIFGGNKNRIIPQRSKVIALSNGPLALSSLYSPKMSRNVLLAFGKSQSGFMFNQSHYHHHKHVFTFY